MGNGYDTLNKNTRLKVILREKKVILSYDCNPFTFTANT